MADNLAVFNAFVDAHNAWVKTGDYSRMLGMMAREARFYFEGGNAMPRLIGRSSIERYLMENRPADTIEITFSEATTDGASSTFRWSVQEDDADSGNLNLQLRETEIASVTWEFFHWQEQPVPWILAEKAELDSF